MCDGLPVGQREPGHEDCGKANAVNDQGEDADHEVSGEGEEGCGSEEEERDGNKAGPDGCDHTRVGIFITKPTPDWSCDGVSAAVDYKHCT